MTNAKTLFNKFCTDAGLALYTDKHHDNLLGCGPNSDDNPPPVTTTTPDMDAYIHHVDFNTRVVVTTARGIVTVMVYHRDEYVYDGNDDIPLTVPTDVRVIDTINFASCDYLSQLHVITNANQCAVAVDAVKQILNNPTELVLHKVK